MDNPKRHSRLSTPLMHVFRAAHEAKDAKRIIDQRNEAGERVIAGRRLRARQIITESMLRREVSRDLDALLNTVALDATVDMENAPHVRKSRSEEHTSELQSQFHHVCRLLLEKKKTACTYRSHDKRNKPHSIENTRETEK